MKGRGAVEGQCGGDPTLAFAQGEEAALGGGAVVQSTG